MLITIVHMVDVSATEPYVHQVRILPGSMQDWLEDSGEYAEWFIEDYLCERSVIVGMKLDPESLESLIDEVRRKFEKAGFEVVNEFAVND